MNKRYTLGIRVKASKTPYKGDIRLIYYGWGGETETNKGYECILKVISETSTSIKWECMDDYGIFEIYHSL